MCLAYTADALMKRYLQLPAFTSDPMQQPSQFLLSFSSASSGSSTVDDGQNHQVIDQQVISSFVEEISRTLALPAEQRESLCVMANFNSTLPKETLFQNLLYVQATLCKLENKVASLVQKFDALHQQLQDSKTVITEEQRRIMQATVKEYLVQPHRAHWDVAQEVMDVLEADQVRRGLELVFGNSKLKKDLHRETRKFATDHRNVLRMIVRNSLGLTQGKSEYKACLTKTVDDIARRFLDKPATGSSPEFFVFVALLRYIARETPTLINRSELIRPQKGKDWWAGVAAWFQEKTQLWGNDKSVGEWFNLIQIIIANERTLHPEDPIPWLPSTSSTIPINQGVPPPTPASTESMESNDSSVNCMDYVPDINYTAGHCSPFQQPIQAIEGQASGNSRSSTQAQYQLEDHHSGPSHQSSVYSSDILYQNSYYYWPTSDDQTYE
ncbi:hypothetical protein M422DRAFT_246165 [Sphaerobolus stellatus SS14]|nr:hypothetical protein M422DRAFT_246165 [Sphaerobolus stellatus SS14]